MRAVIAAAVAGVVFLVVDLVWLGLVAQGFYRSQLGPLLAEKVNWAAGLGFYALYLAGLWIFVVAPGLEEGSAAKAAGYGFLFGLVAYGTYDLTNLATVRNWPLALSFVDLLWGGILSALSSYAAVTVAGRF